MKNLISILLLAALLACSNPKKRYLSQNMDQDFCAGIHRDTTVTLSQQLEPYSELMMQKTGVYVLENGAESMVARAWLADYAEHSIDIQYFIFSADNIGLIASDYLLRAAERGVKVRVLVDDILVDTDADELVALDAHENLSIKIYNPGINVGKTLPKKLFKLTTDFRGANQRMHNKNAIVDGKIVITGGRNIADEYFDYDKKYNFRDRDVLLLGGTATRIQESFTEYWNHALSISVTKLVKERKARQIDVRLSEWLHQYACDPENFYPQIREKIKDMSMAFDSLQKSGELQWVDSVYFVADIPGKNKETESLLGGGLSTDALIKLVKQAKKSVTIQTPYLITTKLGRNLFQDAVKRGVTVRILTNSLASTDNLEAFNGYQRTRKKLLKAGIKIYEFRPDAAIRYKMMTRELHTKLDKAPIFGLHAKSMVIDGEIAVIGTFNLDPRSANLNTECLTVIHSVKIASDMLKVMEEEFKPENSWEATLKFNPDSKSGFMKRFGAWTRGIIPKSIL
jgi:phosphatidylserine/phosphatidylglycerophosphate/cardiolipin synthase-like enzyme